ncbi:hypothetical protein K474DRAFT_1225214 [Panus rudis PR-1116 ss-1]|nr:hypothetical protein K474DRAFT_1225214 [Panus rudis PR-1116 ss-1]
MRHHLTYSSSPGHIFCGPCIEGWIKQSPLVDAFHCPQCRSTQDLVSPDTLRRVYLPDSAFSGTTSNHETIQELEQIHIQRAITSLLQKLAEEEAKLANISQRYMAQCVAQNRERGEYIALVRKEQTYRDRIASLERNIFTLQSQLVHQQHCSAQVKAELEQRRAVLEQVYTHRTRVREEQLQFLLQELEAVSKGSGSYAPLDVAVMRRAMALPSVGPDGVGAGRAGLWSPPTEDERSRHRYHVLLENPTLVRELRPVQGSSYSATR